MDEPTKPALAKKRWHGMLGKSQNKRSRVYHSNVMNRELVIEPAPHITGRVTKDLLMKYTFVALCIIAAVSYLSYGFDSIIISAISVLVAVTCDYLVLTDNGGKRTFGHNVCGCLRLNRCHVILVRSSYKNVH